MELEHLLAQSTELGKKSNYSGEYDPRRLLAFERAPKRIELNIDPKQLPFYGYDIWNHYEVSWLNLKGKPMVAMAEIIYASHSPRMIESKSLKLYFNGFNQSYFASVDELQACIVRDLSDCVGLPVKVSIKSIDEPSLKQINLGFPAENIDDLDIECYEYQVNPHFLSHGTEVVEECLSSDLLKSNCLVTHQPDWGSVYIAYQGPKIDRAGLLRYLVSFRNHNEFHEQCIERIFVDIQAHCQPQVLTVYGRYTRRGGLDINPYRSTEKPKVMSQDCRLVRQ